MTAPIGITLSLDGVQKFEADGRRAAGTVDSIGVSAKQTAAALRGVPAQFTDIITSLQGGQAPLTVLLQQGGQLKDMFGGVGAAAKGLGGYVAGLVNPFSMAAAAAVGVAVAYKQGSAEADSYRAALITTGNAAGATAAQMQQMAGRIGAIVGTQGAAADALAQMAASGRVAAQNFEYFGEVALKTEKSIGTAVSETVKQFAELGKSPVEASRKLNEETNYLTAAIYEQIKALKDQGRDADAAALAQKTYADALNGRSAQMTQNLGVIEKAWQGITGAAKGAWDAMLNVGRQDTLATKMDDVRAKIAQAQGQDKNRRFSLPWDTPLAELQQQLSYLSEEERMLRRGAEAQAARTQAEKAAIDAADALRKTQEKGLTKQQQMNKALEEYRKQQDELRATNPTSALLSPGAIAVGERVIRDQFKETGSRSGTQANAYAAEQEAAKVWAKTLKDVEKGIADVEEKTLGLNKAQAALLEYISSPAYATNSEEMRQAALARLYAWDAAIKNADGIKAEKAAMEQASKAMATWFDARSKDASALTSQVQARREEVAAMGLSADAVSRLSAAKYEQAAAEQEAYAAALKSAKLYAGEYAQAYDAAAQDALDQAKRLRELGSLDLAKGQKQAALDAEAEWKRTSDSINQSLTDALLRGFESGKDFAKNLRDTVVNMFKTMVLRPVISAIVNPVAGAITGAMGLSGAANAGQSALSTIGTGASIFNAGSALGGLGAVGGAMSGFATAATASVQSLLGMSGTVAQMTTSLAAAGHTAAAGVSAGVNAFQAIPGWGWAIGAVAALAAIFGKKATPHAGAASTYSEAGGLVSGADIYRASGLADTRTYNAGVEQVTGNVAKAIGDTLNSTAKAFGKTAGYEITTAFADDTSKDGAWGSLIIKQMGEAVIDWRDTQTSKWAPKEFADGEKGSAEYLAAVAKSARDAIISIGLPEWAERLAKAAPEPKSMDDLAAMMQQISQYPAQLLQQFGTTRDAMVQQFAQGLATGDAASAGQTVADTLVASIQNAVYTNAAGQIFDTVNMGIVTPMLDAIATGASVADALSQATIDKTIERAKAQAQALAELYGNADFAAAMEQLRTAVGGALGQAGSYIQTLPQTLVATQQIDTAAQDAARAAEEAQRAWQQITDGLLADQASLQIELLRAQGREEDALAAERTKAIEGYDAYQTALYDSNTALRSQIDTLRELGELLPSVIDQYLTPEQRTSNAYSGIASDLVGAGLAGMDAGALAQALAGATKGEIAEAATAIYQMTGVTDEMRVALLRAAGSLATLKDEAASVADAGLDSGYSALERAVQARRSVVQDTVNDVRAVFDTVRSASRSLFGEVDGVVQFQADAGRAFITQSLSAARSTGYLPDGDQLSEAIDAARAGLQGQVFASQAEADFQKLVLANELKALQDISGDQLTEAEQQLKALDGILDSARAQIDALRGIDNSVTSVEAALQQFGNALLAATGKSPAAAKAAGTAAGAAAMPDWATFGVGDWMTSSTGSLVFDNSTGMLYGQGDVTSHRSQLRDAAAALLEAGQSQALYDAVRGSGFTLDQADTILGLPAGEAEKWARSLGLPVFHDGTPYVPRTGFAVLEQGEAVIPRAFNHFTGGGSAVGNTERLERLVEAMASELAQMRAQLDEANRHAARTADATNGRPEAPVLVEVVA